MPSSYAVGDHFEKFIDDQVRSGRYASASEVVRDALRLMESREAVRRRTLDEVRDLIRVGMESGPGIPAKDVFSRLRRKYRDQAKALTGESRPQRRAR
ncbi:MAG TPA: type II toxin-antitoxin system ParD family antitoxin [Vineibacter sp.]|nr:type II toxin-antitoxin system ParD family antitoxin [Vineibacter sp.]